MATLKTKHRDGMLDFTGNGREVRLEQRYAPVVPEQRRGKDGKPLFTAAGKPITSNVPHPKNEVLWVAYELTKTKEHPEREGLFVHPWHGEATSHTHVWMPIGEGTYEQVLAMAEKVVGKIEKGK